MTDEEKAEEYSIGKAHEHYHFLFEENNGSPIDFAKLCFLDGLAEGRKERNCVNCSNHGKQFEVMKLEKENARLSKMLEMAINDTIRKGNQCFYCKDNYTKDICDNCTKENRINVMKLYRAELEKRVENEK